MLLTDEADEPLRPAILYGIDTRAGRQIERLDDRYGCDEILSRCGSALSSQAAGAKVAWVADEEPELFARARRLYMPSSFLANRLTGAYVLDHHSASQCTPLYDSPAPGLVPAVGGRDRRRHRAPAAAAGPGTRRGR